MDVDKRSQAFHSGLSTTYVISAPPKPLDAKLIDRGEERQIGTAMLSSMNEEQKEVAKLILESARSESSQNCFYIDAPGRTGETYLFTCFAHHLEGEGILTLCLASSGIAASLLPRGTTVHTGLSLPLDLTKDSRLSFNNRSVRADKLQQVRVILWDEAPMLSSTALEVIEVSLRQLMGNDIPFGGKIIVLGGDFRQIPPVIPHGSEAKQQLSECIKRSLSWKHFHDLRLTKNLRARPEQIEFSNRLLQLGERKQPTTDDQNEIPQQCITEVQ